MRLPSSQRPLLLAALAALALIGVFAHDLQREHNLAIEGARGRTQRISGLLEQQALSLTDRLKTKFARINHNLNQAAQPAADAAAPSSAKPSTPSPAQVQAVLNSEAFSDSVLPAVAVIDPQGRLTASSGAMQGLALPDAQQLAAHGASANIRLHFGRPQQRGQRWLLAVTRRLDGPGGEFAGVLAAWVDITASITHFYEAVDVGEKGFATLFLQQGWIVARQPANPQAMQRNWSDTPMFAEHLPRAASNTVRQTVAIDGVDRIYSYRTVNGGDFVVAYGLSVAEVLADWRSRLWRDGVVVVLLLLVLGAAALSLTRHLQRREAAEAALALSRRNLATTLNALDDAVVTVDAEGRVLDTNAAAQWLAGRSTADAIGQQVTDLFCMSEELGSGVLIGIQQVLAAHGAGHRHLEAWRQLPSGPPLRVLCRARQLQRAEGVMAYAVLVISDVTPQHMAQQAVVDNQRRLAAVVAASHEAIITVDDQRCVLLFNPAAQRIFGCTEAQALGQALDGFLPASKQWAPHPLADAAQGLEPTPWPFGRDVHLSGLRADGTAFPATASISGAELDGRRLLTVMLRDMSAEHESRQQLTLLKTAIERMGDTVMITAAEPLGEAGRPIVFVNDAFERLTGWKREEVLGRSPRLLQGPDTQQTELDRMAQALAVRQPVRSELINYRKDGQPFWLELEISPIIDEQGQCTHMVAIERDITQRKQDETQRGWLEEQLRESQKMESIGTLAGGIAHDFNNILGAMLGNAHLGLSDAPPGSTAHSSLQQVHKSALRARHLVEQILSFSRRRPLTLKTQALQPVVDEALHLLRTTLPARVRLNRVFDEEPLHVEMDATQLHQVVMNLCTNAWRALRPAGGEITVGVAATHIDSAAALRPVGLAPGAHVQLWVQDDGVGMDESTRARLFEPFFTTRALGEGTGLGLSVVHGIVKSHHGAIAVDSWPGQGTRFDIWLPASSQSAAQGGEDTAAEDWVGGNGGRVIYVDDDEVMALMVERLLVQHHFQPACYANGHAALAALQADPSAFAAVVTDYNMPGMSGLELAAAVALLQPALPVIISSGYISDELAQGWRQAGVFELLNKAETFEQLPALLQRALAQVAELRSSA